MRAAPSDQLRYVAYYRVSARAPNAGSATLSQQRERVRQVLRRRGGAVVRFFTELERKGGLRPELTAALLACQHKQAILLIAKAQDVAQDQAFLAQLAASKTHYIACDVPAFTPEALEGLMSAASAAAAADAARRGRDVAAARARGERLGAFKPRRDATAVRAGSLVDRVRAADLRAEQLQPVIESLIEEGCYSASAIARGLNARGVRAPMGGVWTGEQVLTLRRRQLKLHGRAQ